MSLLFCIVWLREGSQHKAFTCLIHCYSKSSLEEITKDQPVEYASPWDPFDLSGFILTSER